MKKNKLFIGVLLLCFANCLNIKAYNSNVGQLKQTLETYLPYGLQGTFTVGNAPGNIPEGPYLALQTAYYKVRSKLFDSKLTATDADVVRTEFLSAYNAACNAVVRMKPGYYMIKKSYYRTPNNTPALFSYPNINENPVDDPDYEYKFLLNNKIDYCIENRLYSSATLMLESEDRLGIQPVSPNKKYAIYKITTTGNDSTFYIQNLGLGTYWNSEYGYRTLTTTSTPSTPFIITPKASNFYIRYNSASYISSSSTADPGLSSEKTPWEMEVFCLDAVSDNIAFQIKDGQAIVLGLLLDIPIVTIPEIVSANGQIYPVTTIKDYAFYGLNSLKTVSLPSTITKIGNQAFANCTSLTGFSVDANNQSFCTINKALYSIDNTTLYAMPGGKSGNIELPSSVTDIKPGAFMGCQQMTSVTIPEGVTAIKDSTFYKCSALKYINFKAAENLQNIGSYAFSNCTSLKRLDFKASENLQYIGNKAFSNCSSLSAMKLRYVDRSKLGTKIFDNCKKLDSIYISPAIPSRLESISSLFGTIDSLNCALFIKDGSGNISNLYRSTSGWENFRNIKNYYELSVPEYGFTSLYLPYASTLSADTYTGTINGKALSLKKITDGVLPSLTGAIIKAPAGLYYFTESDKNGTAESDLLGQTRGDTPTPDNCYMIDNQLGVTTFYRYPEQTLEANRAYIISPLGLDALDLTIDGINTGIGSIKAQQKAPIYDLQGRKASATDKGLYIQNGKKVMK